MKPLNSNKLTFAIEKLDFNARALLFAELSAIAYYNLKSAKTQARRLGFTTIEFYSNSGAEAYRFMNKYDIVIACRGTEPTVYNDIKADTQTWPVLAEHRLGRLHRGFKNETDKLWPAIKEDLIREQSRRHVWLCGHSLGAAMSTVIASRCKNDSALYNPKELHTFGSPRVAWKTYFSNTVFTHYRWVNNADIVTRVPFTLLGYIHHGACRYFNHYGNIRKLHGWQRTKDIWRGIASGLLKGKVDSFSDHNIKHYIAHLAKIQKKD